MLQVPQPEIESHLNSETRAHLDLVYTKLKNTEDELRNTEDQLDLACEELKNTKEQFKETTKKHEERINALENKPFTYMWKIDAFQEVLKRAKAGHVIKIDSDSFYTSECGYKVRLGLFPNGFSTGVHTHLSIYFNVLKGEFDSILKWPFAKRVTFTLIDQHKNLNDRKNITKTISENREQESFYSRLKFLVIGMNGDGGFAKFVSHDALQKRGYSLNDTIFIQAKFETVA